MDAEGARRRGRVLPHSEALRRCVSRMCKPKADPSADCETGAEKRKALPIWQMKTTAERQSTKRHNWCPWALWPKARASVRPAVPWYRRSVQLVERLWAVVAAVVAAAVVVAADRLLARLAPMHPTLARLVRRHRWRVRPDRPISAGHALRVAVQILLAQMAQHPAQAVLMVEHPPDVATGSARLATAVSAL